ncbi:hypothetical protein HPP92_005680 [Vanilla planifolia]|uniref:Uncharacterized protein n=1 Tax=Vanilla planifolia TaxID=51239 RepID=A0A835RUH2_VANPL|nr:hypothetical protein HPP92_005680 [Vanilla planifolia]
MAFGWVATSWVHGGTTASELGGRWWSVWWLVQLEEMPIGSTMACMFGEDANKKKPSSRSVP